MTKVAKNGQTGQNGKNEQKGTEMKRRLIRLSVDERRCARDTPLKTKTKKRIGEGELASMRDDII